ncbi:MAG: hypothetical protein Q8M16_03925 [Pirellulaceae bacterium]|nr:hypothetical protein [Pirellulaceae bacterium]
MSEREAFLLRALQTMLAEEGLLANPNDVVIVAAPNAWPEYNELHAYICQPFTRRGRRRSRENCRARGGRKIMGRKMEGICV